MPAHTAQERLKHRFRQRSRDGRVAAAFREVSENEPSVVAKTRKKFGALRARRQKVAIVLSKAREAGASIPRR